MNHKEEIMSEKINQEWPGVYPRNPGWWQFNTELGRVICVEVEVRVLEGLGFRINGGRWRKISETKPEQWGPEIRMVNA